MIKTQRLKSKKSEELKQRLASMNIHLNMAENVSGDINTYDFKYFLWQEDMPYSAVLAVYYNGMEVVTIEFIFDLCLTPQLSLEEHERIECMLIRELISKTAKGMQFFLAKKLAHGVTHHFQIMESDDREDNLEEELA